MSTTAAPDNLFLHASAVWQRWPALHPLQEAPAESRPDTVLSIALGGGVTMPIFITGAGVLSSGQVAKAPEMARQLEPPLGWGLGG
jgi:manganese transport protein